MLSAVLRDPGRKFDDAGVGIIPRSPQPADLAPPLAGRDEKADDWSKRILESLRCLPYGYQFGIGQDALPIFLLDLPQSLAG